MLSQFLGFIQPLNNSYKLFAQWSNAHIDIYQIRNIAENYF